MKYLGGNPFTLRRKSLPVRGAWIEIRLSSVGELKIPRRSPCGERGLK